jgi:protein SCO1/2
MPSSRPRFLASATTILIIVPVLTFGLGCSGDRTVAQPTAESPANGSLLPDGVRPHTFTLENQYGRRVSLRQYRGRVTVLTFLSAACGPACRLVAQQIRGALDELSRPVPALAISTDPGADTPARIAHLLSEASLTGRLQYLTGTIAQLAPLWHDYGLSTGRSDRVSITDRSAFVLLIDKRGFERISFPLEDLTPEGLAQNIRRLQSE